IALTLRNDDGVWTSCADRGLYGGVMKLVHSLPLFFRDSLCPLLVVPSYRHRKPVL
ncbi:hypothetical protein BDZ89DRAFT_1070823, partial [Hymenopellis radicata]